MAFNNFPYTDGHELNLDWVISIVKRLQSYVDTLGKEYEDAVSVLSDYLTTEKLSQALHQLGYPNSYIYNSPDIIPGITPIVPSDPTEPDSSTYTDLITAYDALPYLSKYTWGYDEDSNPLVWYVYTPLSYRRTHFYPNAETGEHTGKLLYENNNMSCSIICVAGLHGNERQNVASLYAVTKWLMESDESLAKFMRDNFQIRIMPCANPWGYINNSRYNMDGVDINRNFPPNWNTYTASHPNVNTGTEALSTKSAQCLQSLLNSIPEDCRFTTSVFDFHDFRGATRADGESYASYNFIETATLPTAKQKGLYVLTWLLQYMESNGYDVYRKSDTPLLFANISSGPLFIHYAWTLGYRNSHLFENRINLTGSDNTYEPISAKLSSLEVGLAITGIAPLVTLERQPTDIRKLSELDMSTSNTLDDICNALPYGSRLCFYVTTANMSTTLGGDLPGSSGGVLEINRPINGSNSAICKFTVGSTSTPTAYYRVRNYYGVFSSWYQYTVTSV